MAANRISVHFARMITGGVRTCSEQQLMYCTHHHHRHLLIQSPVSRFSSVRFKSNGNLITDPDFSVGFPNTNNPSTDSDLTNSTIIERILAQKYPDLSIKHLMDYFSWEVESLELRDSLEDDPNPLNLCPTQLNFMKTYPGVPMDNLKLRRWMELHPDSFIEERMPYWFPWWTSRTAHRGECCAVVCPNAKDDPNFIRLARFAIREHNRKENAHLEFVRLEGACSQPQMHFLYHIILEARNAAGGQKGLFRAEVVNDEFSETSEFLRMVPMMQQPPTLLKVFEESNV